MTSVFGLRVLPRDIEGAALTTLFAWLPTYLADVEREAGVTVGDVARPVRWKIAGAWDDLPPEGGWPALALISPGPTDLERNDSGGWDGWYRLTVGVAARAEDKLWAKATTDMLCWAALAVLLDKCELRAIETPSGWTWSKSNPARTLDIRIDNPPGLTLTPPGDARNQAATSCDLAFFVKDIAAQTGGPDVPAENDGTDEVPAWPTADSVDIDIQIAS